MGRLEMSDKIPARVIENINKSPNLYVNVLLKNTFKYNNKLYYPVELGKKY